MIKKSKMLVAFEAIILVAGCLMIGFSASWWAACGVIFIAWSHNIEKH